MSDSLKIVADSVAQVAGIVMDSAAVDTVNWTRECYFMLVDIRGDLNLIFALILGAIGYRVLNDIFNYYEKRKKKKANES